MPRYRYAVTNRRTSRLFVTVDRERREDLKGGQRVKHPEPSYEHAPLPVRADFGAAHRRFWQRLQRPGSWWTSAERIAIAAETRQGRDCELCQRRRASLSPNAPAGAHDTVSSLAPEVIDAVHRLATDPSRLTKGSLRAMIDAGFTAGHYVELVSTVAAIISIDSFCRGIGVAFHMLPVAGRGAPTHYQPANAVADDAWVPMIPADRNSGAEADLWPRGRTGNVIRALSLVPDEVRTLGDLSAAHYLPNAQVGDPTARSEHLDRSQIELIAGRVSALNQCYY